jgi:hypothetical protein
VIVMKSRLLPVVVVGAAIALGGAITYAVAQATNVGHRSMMGGGSGYTMMGTGGEPSAWDLNGSGPVSTIPAARAQAQRFADRLRLTTGEVMQFSNNFYVLLTDKQRKPATEVLVDRDTGAVTLEYGPAMMWNTRYGMMGGIASTGTGSSSYGGMMSSGMMGATVSGAGMMGSTASGGGMVDGMMGRYGGSPNWTPGAINGRVNVTQAQALGNRWLSEQGTGLTAGEPEALPGYFTFHTLRDGKITGMLSVNARTGAVWFHWWHGRFVAMEE